MRTFNPIECEDIKLYIMYVGTHESILIHNTTSATWLHFVSFWIQLTNDLST